jgi:hypothetical protein
MIIFSLIRILGLSQLCNVSGSLIIPDRVAESLADFGSLIAIPDHRSLPFLDRSLIPPAR